MQMPPVSENTEHNKADYKTAHDLYFLLNESYKKTKHNTEVVHFFEVTFSIIDWLTDCGHLSKPGPAAHFFVFVHLLKRKCRWKVWILVQIVLNTQLWL